MARSSVAACRCFLPLVALLSPSFVISDTRARVAFPTSISLERTWCFGPCPVYKVTLRASGGVFYEGEANVARVGKYTARIDEQDYQRIAAWARRLGFSHLKPSYSSGVTCQSSAITRVVVGDELFETEDNGSSGPSELWALEEIIDGVVASATQWEAVPTGQN